MKVVSNTYEPRVSIERLSLHPDNPREGDVGAIHQSIEANGFYGAILAQVSTGYILAGNHRFKAALEHGATEVPVLWLDCDDDRARKILLTDNRASDLASNNNPILIELLKSIRAESQDGLVGTGYTDEDIQELIEQCDYQPEGGAGGAGGTVTAAADEAGLRAIERMNELKEKWRVEPGQLWRIASLTNPDRPHRILCGDSTNADDVKRLLGDRRPALMLTDPPYGVEYDPQWRNEFQIKRGENPTNLATRVQNDDRCDWTAAWALFPGDIAYVWHAGLYAADVANSLLAANLIIRAQIIWAKQQFVFGRGHYHWQHEPCWYAVRKGKVANWKGDRAQSTLWQVNGLNPAEAKEGQEDSRTLHSTQKPLDLYRRPLLNHTDTGAEVYEPFSGSGTCLVACEQLGRSCYAIEIDPGYLAVALERLAGLGLVPILDE